MFRTRVGDWWEETEPMLTHEGRVHVSMMVTPETRRWRTINRNEIERGPYSCFWGAPALFSGQWAAPIAENVIEQCPAMADRVRPWLLELLEKTDQPGLRALWAMPGHELPRNLPVSPARRSHNPNLIPSASSLALKPTDSPSARISSSSINGQVGWAST
jgi:hypothetical protein